MSLYKRSNGDANRLFVFFVPQKNQTGKPLRDAKKGRARKHLPEPF